MVLALTIFHVAALFAAALLFVAAAVCDARSYRIPNYFCGFLLLLFPVFAATSPQPIDWRQNAIVFGLISAMGFAAFLGKWVGAGDVKLLSVASLWAGPQFLVVLLAVTAFAGGVESLAAVIALYLKSSKTKETRCWTKTQIPYGIAIATGGVAMLSLMAQPILLPD